MNVSLNLRDHRSVAQCLRTLLLTPKGAAPFRPNFGLGVERLLGIGIDKMRLRAEIIAQIETYEPRIIIDKIYFLAVAQAEQLRIAIEYTMKATGEQKAYFFNTNNNPL